ncbi:MAG TPA: PVC-type heme-binding CxxCH protein, partial [Bradyrhizobium sp.]|nr:PVC-type heme-binding CxxCH protein [Bradyrhizobium sp.]
MQRQLRLWLIWGIFFAPAPLFAQRDLKDIPDPDPEIERKSFIVADGFEVNLYAADPKIAKPIQMNFDAQGRLWIASSEIYPHIQPGQQANDKIVVVEDTDGDGRADVTSIFAEGLLIPTGVEPGDGGAYVANSTELVHLADTDGDGKADSRQVLLSGFGTEDTHHILHTLRWGMDGMLYFNQSIYIHSHIETPWGVRRLGGGGIWQFRPETMQLEIFCRGFVNPWGHQFDAWGQSFATDGAFGDGINYVFPGSVFVTAPGAARIMKGLNPGSPKHCGLEIAGGSHLPESWRGNMLTNDFRGHRVCRFVISEDRSGYASREQAEVIKTDHVAFRPIDITMGPDGAIYIADWYNPIIQHGEVDFRDPRRDHTHGRIWRVTAKNRPLVKRPQLVGAPVPALLNSLKSPEPFARHHARRVLKECGAKDVIPALAKWVAATDRGDSAAGTHLLEALWTFQALDVPEPRLLIELLRSADHRVRAAAVRVLSAWRDRIADAGDLLVASVVDEHPRVRLEAIRALAAVGGLRSAASALKALDHPMDENLDFALWEAARDLAPDWLPALARGEAVFGGSAAQQIFALEAVASPEVVRPLVDLMKANKIPIEYEDRALALIAVFGGPPELRLVLDLALADAGRAERWAATAKLLAALTEAALRRKVVPAGDLSPVGNLLNRDAELSAAVWRAVGVWKIDALRPRLEDFTSNAAEYDPVVKGAIDGLVLLGGDPSRRILSKLGQPPRPRPLRRAATVALAGLDPAAAANAAIELLTDHPSSEEAAALFAALWQQKAGPAAFLAALGEYRLSADVAKLGVRSARTSGRDLADVIAALMKSGGLSDGPKTLSAQEMHALVELVKERGDAARGEAIFRRADQVCLKCHSVSGAGGQVGPDLASIGASAQVDYLIESLVEPNKAIKENYHSLIVENAAGKTVTGVKVRTTEAELILR